MHFPYNKLDIIVRTLGTGLEEIVELFTCVIHVKYDLTLSR